ncbi:MAG: hypothetical protein LBC52_08080 [Treponema sp.]|jgi:hypothetical protein|nr:hypothetical protein [Treponema sp.]
MKLPALREIVEERKEKAIENLSDNFAKNKLPLEEYERLVEYIQKIESERELIVVEKMVAEYGGSELPKKSTYEDDEVDDYHSMDHQGSSLTILSSRTISGPVESGMQFVSILGSEHIKIRKADLSRRKTVLNVVSILGECVISVESGIRVSNRAVPILGGAWTDRKVERDAEDGELELVISGAALLGNITVKLLK